jgi:hypothetical protein
VPLHGLGQVAWQYLAITRVWVQSQADPGGRITAQGSTNFHVLIQTKLSAQLLLENFQGSVYPLPFLAFPLKQSKHIKTMAFLEPLLELLRLQQFYQSVHGFGSLHLLSKDENEDEHKDEHHDHDDDDDGVVAVMVMMLMFLSSYRFFLSHIQDSCPRPRPRLNCV